jgi:hypothetical protein
MDEHLAEQGACARRFIAHAVGCTVAPGTGAMAVEIHMLGRVDAIADCRSLPLRGGKQRAVLAMLALRANRTVRRRRADRWALG